MNQVGTFFGVVGIVICILSVFARFIGDNTVFEIQAMNTFHVGIGVIVVGCFAKLCGR